MKKQSLPLIFACWICAAILLLDQPTLVYAQTPGPSWSFTGNLNTVRGSLTATQLPNGKVLVTGGLGSGPFIDSAELYDPVTGTWRFTGTLQTPRVFLHTATMLLNGKVLVAGGGDRDGNDINGAELYDPATETWTPTGNLAVARHSHTATLLPNGKVLVAGGGDTDGGNTDSAELYDPVTGNWSITGSLHTTRGRHTATLLTDGRVLVAGGTDGFIPSLHSCELYDPNTGTWSVTGSLKTDRALFTATLLGNGNVLVTGGETHHCSFGGCGFSMVTNTSELYNPATGTWSFAGFLGHRSSHTATLLQDGRVLVAGGANFNASNAQTLVFLSSTDLYDPATGNWTNTASLNLPRVSHTATLLTNGKVLVAGAGNGTAELYDTAVSSPPSPIDDAQFFVRQHYLDFLNREPDPQGLTFWTNEILSCGNDLRCIEVKRINVSAAFFLSIEFQNTGYLVERIYKVAYGDASGMSSIGGAHTLSVPIVRLDDFLADTRLIGEGVVVLQPGWEQLLERNKATFAEQFVQRPRFTTAYPQSVPVEEFVNRLNANAGGFLSPAECNSLVGDLSSGLKTRAQVLRAVAEQANESDDEVRPNLASAEFNRAFVLMQYFGYLRRNPNDVPDVDYSGYDFWLTKLNTFNGNFVNAEMVKAFLASGEYRTRF